MAAVLRLKVNFPISSTLCVLSTYSVKKCLLNCAPILSGIRFYKGSARDTRRREWNKKMAQMKRETTTKKFDYKQFISTNYEKELFAFAHRLNLNPNNLLLRTALTHKSYETDSLVEENSKLAVLGYNIATQFISEYLFFSFASFPNYGLRSLHEYLVSRRVLVKVARSLSIPELIRSPYNLDSSEEINELNITKEDIISDSLLALIGSIYLDEGCAQARAFVHDFIIVELYSQELKSVIEFKNPEISLAALLLQQNKDKPVARVISRSGKYTDTPAYVVGIFSSQSLLGTGVNCILEKARQEAYSTALTKLLQRNLRQMPEPDHQNKTFKSNKL